jgi:hypothetical protein
MFVNGMARELVPGYSPVLVENGEERKFYRLHRSCRPASLTRIGEVVGAANADGWPVNVRYCLWQRTRKIESPPLAASIKEFRTQARPQPSEDAPACPTSLRSFPEGHHEFNQASQMCSERKRLRIFELAKSSGGKIVTIKIHPPII